MEDEVVLTGDGIGSRGRSRLLYLDLLLVVRGGGGCGAGGAIKFDFVERFVAAND